MADIKKIKQQINDIAKFIKRSMNGHVNMNMNMNMSVRPINPNITSIGAQLSPTPTYITIANYPGTGVGQYQAGTPTTGWMKLAFETDEKVFRQYVQRMKGRMLVCTDHIEEETFIVPKANALRYVYQGLKGKFPNTDVEALDDMSVDDEIQYIRFEMPVGLYKQDIKQFIISAEKEELDEFLAQIEEERKLAAEETATTTLTNNFSSLITGSTGMGYYALPFYKATSFTPVISGHVFP